jgi:ABC-type antimicrobial peptide transport system permease subunit
LLWFASGRIPIEARLELPPATVLLGIAFALILALVSSLLPALRTFRLEIAEALAGR